VGCIPRCLLQGYSVITKRNSGVSLSANFEAMKGFPRTYRLTACNYSYIQLIDFNARFYSPRLGRFIQPDIVIPNPANPQSLNHYAYVRNNPINYVDPSGHVPELECEFGYGECPNDSAGTPTSNLSSNISQSSTTTQSHEVRYWRGMSEQDLAMYLQKQMGNTCAKYSVAMALSMLDGIFLDGNKIMQMLGDVNRYSVLWNNNWGSFMYQVNGLANDLANSSGLNHSSSLANPSVDEFKDYLSDPNSLVLVSVTSLQQLNIYYGKEDQPNKWDATFYGHVMVMVAYDETHSDVNGDLKPWGFLSSWKDGQNSVNDEIYWMANDDFNQTVGQYSIWSSVIITIP